MNYLIHLAIMTCIYLVQIYGFNLLLGTGGLLSLCQAAFYGIGAYACALLMMNLHLPFLAALALSAVFTGAFAALVGMAALRFRGESFIIVSLGLQMITYAILYNWIGLTRGPYGIPGIPRPDIFGWQVRSLPEYLVLSVAVLGFTVFVLHRLQRSPYGMALEALRDDELAAEGLGKAPLPIFMAAFVTAAACAALSGSLYATYVTYIDPTSFTLDESFFLVTILLVGGSGNLRGPLCGTLFMILLPEGLRFVGLPDAVAPNVRQMIYGVLLVLLMFVRPQGIAGKARTGGIG